MCLKGFRGESHRLQTQCLRMLQDPACASLLSSPLVIPLLMCDSDALPGAADRADPCGKLLLQHHRVSASTEDHTYPSKASHEQLPARSRVRWEDSAALCSMLFALLSCKGCVNILFGSQGRCTGLSKWVHWGRGCRLLCARKLDPALRAGPHGAG